MGKKLSRAKDINEELGPIENAWKYRLGFILAAMGSAIGLGNIWRFPQMAYEHGGGSFLIPYIVALLLVGIPLLLMEFYLGFFTKLGTPNAFAKLKKPFKLIGYAMIINAFVIVSYYTVIIAWSLVYLLFALVDNLNKDLLSKIIESGSRLFLGDFNLIGLIYLLSFLLVWLITFLILYGGVKNIEKVSLIFLPLMWILLIVFLIKVVLLPGSTEGIIQYLTPNYKSLLSPDTWVAAFGQIFFSLSLAFGIMITYAKYLHKKNLRGAEAVALGNSSFELLAGFIVFGILGFLMIGMGVSSISELAEKGLNYSGVGLAFITFPVAIGQMSFSYLFGILFFLLLFLAGLTSLISLIEAFVVALEEDLKIKRDTLLIILSILGFLSGLIYIYNINILDKVDWFVNYTLITLGFLEAIILSYFFNKVKNSKKLILKIGRITAPILLFIVLLAKIFNTGSEKILPSTEINIGTWISLLLILIVFSGFLYHMYKEIEMIEKNA